MARSPWPRNSAGGTWNLVLAPPWKPPFSQGCFQPILAHLWLCCCRFQGSLVVYGYVFTPQTPSRPIARPTSAHLLGRGRHFWGSPQPSPFAYVRAFDALRLRFHVKKVPLKIMFIVKKNNACII